MKAIAISKKAKGILIAAVCLCLVAAVIFAIGLELYRSYNRLAYNLYKYQVKDFKSNKAAFNIVAQKVLALYDEAYSQNNDIQCLVVLSLGDTWKLSYLEGTDFGEGVTAWYEATQEEQDAYHQASSLLAKTATGICMIRVWSDRVVFYTETPYVIVYMRQGGKPKDVSMGSMYSSFYAEKLAFKWYEVAFM
jgi:hypothetical protein